MEPTEQDVSSKSSFRIVWVLAVLVVIGVWAGAYALRGGGNEQAMAGWADGMPAGQALAEDADKPMVVLFTAGWCPPCQQLKKNVLTKDEVNDALQAGFVPVQIDLTDQSSSNPNLAVAQQYGVQGIPMVVAMTPDGEPIEVYSGRHDVAGFTGWLEQLSR